MPSQTDKRAVPGKQTSTRKAKKEEVESQRRYRLILSETEEWLTQIPDVSCIDFRAARAIHVNGGSL
jgi:hypothetical protein